MLMLNRVFPNSDFRLIRQVPKTVFKTLKIPQVRVEPLLAHEASVLITILMCLVRPSCANFGTEQCISGFRQLSKCYQLGNTLMYGSSFIST